MYPFALSKYLVWGVHQIAISVPSLQAPASASQSSLDAWDHAVLHPQALIFLKQISISDSITTPETIWKEIASVPEIQSDEIRQSWIYQLGFPKPLAATLDYEGVGGKRIATFEREVSFFEVIETWSPPELLSFSIEADPAFIPANASTIVGGRFYDVLDGTYRIEPLGPNRCRLHLTSTA